MSSDNVVIDVQGVSKWFDVSGRGIKRGPSEAVERESEGLRFGKKRYRALEDVSFQVRQSECVGIVGRNGAGKSTLLRIISGMMKPSKGSVAVHGEPQSIMGIGVGLQQALTGAENIRIKSATMGLSDSEIDKRYDWIASFAELGDFLNQPLRTYSKGMRSRLAFAITFAFDPSILIIDESLSGGDGGFKRKAQARINEINESGATILLVSHGGAQHKRLCDRSILLDKGRIVADGPPKIIMRYYQRVLATPPEFVEQTLDDIRAADPMREAQALDQSSSNAHLPNEMGDEPQFVEGLASGIAAKSESVGARIVDAAVRLRGFGRVNILPAGKGFKLSAAIKPSQAVTQAYIECAIKNDEGIELGVIRSHAPGEGVELDPSDKKCAIGMKFKNFLGEGDYFVDFTLFGDIGDGVQKLHYCSDLLMFRSSGLNSDLTSGIIHFE